MVETTDFDSSKCSGSDKEMIQDALNSSSNEYGVPIFPENEIIDKERSDVLERKVMVLKKLKQLLLK